MKNRIVLQAPLKLNLQLFAEGDGTSTASAASAAASTSPATPPSGTQTSAPAASTPPATPPANPKAVTFSSQEELDTLISGKVKEAQAQWQQSQQQQKAYEDMTPAEQQAYDLKQSQAQTAQLQLENTKLINKAALSERLATDELPGTLIGVFDDVLGAEDKAIDETYTKITGIFRDAVKAGVDQKLAGSATVLGAGGNGAAAQPSAGEAAAKARNEQHADLKNPWATTK